MENTKILITSQLCADNFGTLDIKADKIRFTDNEITFCTDNTGITIGNFFRTISNFTDYEPV